MCLIHKHYLYALKPKGRNGARSNNKQCPLYLVKLFKTKKNNQQ